MEEKVTHIFVTDYHQRALCFTRSRVDQTASGCIFTSTELIAAISTKQGERSWLKDSNVNPKKQKNPRSSHHPSLWPARLA
jgi:hypothetical protein